jgi:hypothetical protein
VQIRVSGGTNAGWRRVVAAVKDWKCPNCDARNRYYWVRCPVCNHPRNAD